MYFGTDIIALDLYEDKLENFSEKLGKQWQMKIIVGLFEQLQMPEITTSLRNLCFFKYNVNTS